MANASTITPMDWHVGKCNAVWLGKATLSATGALAAGASVDIVVRTPGVTAKDLAFCSINTSPDTDLAIAKVVCALDQVTVTLVNTSGANSTDGAAGVNIMVHRGQ